MPTYPIQLKRSGTASATPSSLVHGELAINYNVADGKLFWKDSSNVIQSFTFQAYALSSHTHAASDITSGTLDAARLPLATTIAAGAVIVGTGLGVSSGTVSVTYGTTSGTACQGNDSRLSDARTPTSHSHGNITNAGAIGSTANLPIITTTSGVLTTGSFGTTAATFCEGNDSRLSDTRTPTDGSVTTAKIANDAVTYAKIQNVSATDRLLGRSSAGSGDVEEITCTAFGRSLIDDADAAAARTTLSVQPTASPAFTGAATVTNDGNVVPLTITNTGTANSFVVNDASGDTSPFVIDASGNVGIGTSSPAAALDVGSGNLRFSSTAQRITGDFSNSTISNRLMFQTSTSNGNTSVRAITNGTATTSNFAAHNGSDANNTSFIAIQANPTETIVNSGSVGTGTNLPLTFYTGGVAQVQISTGGQLLVTAGSASACGVAFSGDPDTGIAQLSAAGANTLSICTNSAERVRVGSGGGVGIGTATTTDALNVVGITSHYQSANGTPALGSKQYYSACFENFSAGYGLALGGVQGGNGAAYLQVQSFSSAVAYPMYLQALGGEVLIGTTTDNGAYLLQVNSQIYATNATIATSDARFKTNVEALTDATAVIAALRPVAFDFIPHAERNFATERQVGLIAQEAQSALAGTDYADSVVAQCGDHLGLAYEKLVPVLIKALQESNARIAALEERLSHA